MMGSTDAPWGTTDWRYGVRPAQRGAAMWALYCAATRIGFWGRIPEPWQVALVVEPHSASGGFFVRQNNGVLDPSRYFGFHELDGHFGRTMVFWSNLSLFEEEGAKTDE